MIAALTRLWREWHWSRQRAIDIEILWPMCKEQAADIDEAREAFFVHAFNDPCWVSFYGEELWPTIRKLT